MSKDLNKSLSYFHDKIFDCIKSNKSIFVLTHIDCDGLSSGSIITKALIRAGANCTVRTTKELSKSIISNLQKNSRDLHVITDLGGGFAKYLDENLAENWVVLDHHEISEAEHENERVINAWKFGIDGGTEICAGGMAYFAANSLDAKNVDLSPIAVVSALGDRQDQGEKKSFTGKNFEIAKTAKDEGLLEIDLDLLLVGRETRPLPDSLAFTSQPFIEGLTWNRDACLSLINSAGIKLKDGQRWRVPAELSEDEKRALIEAITQVTAGKD
ncbi:MAG: DHH family phosphoesterase, partial [Nitrososphaerota archaeon]|nr:DHH family phosphoesterase [Nitrososphaerota archaeon]